MCSKLPFGQETDGTSQDGVSKSNSAGRSLTVTKCTPDSINRELAHLGVVLFVVVERQSGQALDAGFFVGVIQLDLERGPASAFRADEALLAEAHVVGNATPSIVTLAPT